MSSQTEEQRRWKMIRRPGPRDGWYEITPSQAQYLLERGAKNRPLREFRAQQIAAEIQAGTWRPNGETLIFDEKGRVVDGQHRLRAAVLANRAIVAYCVFDIPVKFFSSFDQGAARGGNDLAALMGFENYNNIAAVARLALLYSDGMLGKTGYGKIANERLRLYMERNRDKLNDAVAVTVSRRKGLTKLIPLSHPGFLYFVTSEAQNGRATEFLDKLATGAGLKKGDSLLLFRQRMTDLIGEKHALKQDQKLALLIKTWNAYIHDKPLGTLRWKSDVEAFPQVDLGVGE